MKSSNRKISLQNKILAKDWIILQLMMRTIGKSLELYILVTRIGPGVEELKQQHLALFLEVIVEDDGRDLQEL